MIVEIRGTTAALTHEMKRRAAVEPVIGRIKAERRIDRNYLDRPGSSRPTP